MKKFSFLLIILFLCSISIIHGQTNKIKGQVLDAQTRQPLSGANIEFIHINRGTISNAKGFFGFTAIPIGQHDLKISYMGYEKKILTLDINSDPTLTLEILLTPVVLPTQGVLVTSTRYTRELEDVALPVSVKTARQLENLTPVTVADAMKNEPGLALGRDGVWGTRLVVRGLSQNNLVTLVDGNRVDTAPDLAADLSLVDVNDIDRIEIIRGAGSSLYGTGAIGGVVNIITRKGYYTDQLNLSGAIQGGYHSVNTLGMGHLRFSVSGSRWYFYLSQMLRQANDVRTPDGELPNSQFSDQNLALKTGIRPLANHELKLNYQKFTAKDVGIPGGSALFPAQADVRYPTEGREMLSVELIRRNWSAWLRQTSFKYFIQNIQREVENIPHITKELPGKRVSVLKVTPGADHYVRGAQFQSDWLPSQHYFLLLGVDYWQKRYSGHRSKFQKIEILNPDDHSITKTIHKEIGELPLPDSKYTSTGVFAQDEIRMLNDRLVITAGGRYDWIHTVNEVALNPLFETTDGVRNDNPPNQTILWPAQSDDNHSWSGNVNLLYEIQPHLRFTFTGARSFRSPSLEERYQFIDLGNLVKIGDPNLAPEKGSFSDFGIQLNWKTLALSSHFFWNELTNLVVEQPGSYEGRAALFKENVGQARLVGFDGRLDWRWLPSLSFYGTIAYVQGEDIENNSPLPLIPPLNGQAGVHWRSPLYFNVDFSAHLFATQERVAGDELRTPGYATFNLYLNSRAFNLVSLMNRFILGVENLTNRAYRNHLATNRGLILAEPGRNFVVKWILEF